MASYCLVRTVISIVNDLYQIKTTFYLFTIFPLQVEND